MYESVTHLLPQHTTMDQRCHAAKVLVSELRRIDPTATVPMCVDTLANDAALAYGALPERLVILQGGEVKFIGGRGPEQYSLKEAREALKRLLFA